jgi:hypothetical protein
MVPDVRPYLVPLPETVRWEDWLYRENDDWVPLPDSIEGWDPGTDIRVRRTVRIDLDRFRQETFLHAPSATRLTLSWTSSTTAMTETAPPGTISPAGIGTVEALLEGSRLAGVVTLRTTLSLATTAEQAGPGVARTAGSVLVDDERRLALEGTMSMFPVHAIDFSHTRLPVNASWHLETDTELEAPFLGRFRLLINTRDTELDAAVARGTKDKRQQALCDGLEENLAATLLEFAVRLRDDLRERDSWPPDSIGEVLTRTLQLGRDIHFPSDADDLADFRTRLASAIRSSGAGRMFK